MGDAEDDGRLEDAAAARHSVRCSACKAALDTPGQHSISFLLLDQLTIPLVGCSEHKQQFSDVCGLTTENTAKLLSHQPAGGVRCPSCRHSAHRPQHPVVPVADGAVAVLSCSQHVEDITERFRTGLQTQHRLTTSLPSG